METSEKNAMEELGVSKEYQYGSTMILNRRSSRAKGWTRKSSTRCATLKVNPTGCDNIGSRLTRFLNRSR